jgi:hypothetical protein
MTTPGYYNSGKRIEEGKYYLFQVIGRIVLQDEQSYFILEDPFKIRHLLPVRFYKNYGIEAGGSINCKVDKINCTGRVYLEPEHPYYVVGQFYSFPIHHLTNHQDKVKISIVVTDVFENEISVAYPKDFIIGNIENKAAVNISCKVANIRKGKPILLIAPELIKQPINFSDF